MQANQSIGLAALLLFTACAGSQKNESTTVSKNYKLAYNVSMGKDNYDIFSVAANGSERKNINNHKDVAWTYYAHKDRLFFISDRDTCYRCFLLYESDINGNNIRRITSPILEDSWMSSRNNGKEMIVSGRNGKSRHQLYIINTESGEFKQITNDTAASFKDPLFSPDGKKVVCVYKAQKRDRNQAEELYLISEDGKPLQQITHYPESEKTAMNSNGYKAGAPRWHPTENFISYISMQGGKHGIYAVSPDGSKQWKISRDNTSEGFHDWSSDGRWLAFDKANANESRYEIFLMNWKTKEQVSLTTDTVYKYHQSPVFVEVKN